MKKEPQLPVHIRRQATVRINLYTKLLRQQRCLTNQVGIVPNFAILPSKIHSHKQPAHKPNGVKRAAQQRAENKWLRTTRTIIYTLGTTPSTHPIDHWTKGNLKEN